MKRTEELINEIVAAENPETFISENAEDMINLSLSQYLRSKLEEHNQKKATIFKKAGMEGSNYGYELFRNDEKIPSRNILLAICLAFSFTLEETQMALHCAGISQLYPRDARDVYIIFGIQNGLSLEEIDELLESQGLETIL